MKFFFFFFFTTPIFAFTLNNNFSAAFRTNRVNVTVASNTDCTNAGLTPEELNSLIKPAVDQFWNKVPTSALKLIAAGFSTTQGTDINTDRLCSPTDENCLENSSAPIIPPVNDIVIACNQNDENFGGPTATNVIAITVPNHFSGRNIEGAVILINNFSDVFSKLSRSDQIATIAHEIGHAIGLGHAESQHKEALMYYKTSNLRKNLAQDDMDGISYLYPVDGDGCGLIVSSVDDKKQLPPYLGMVAAFLSLIVLSELKKLVRQLKTRTAL